MLSQIKQDRVSQALLIATILSILFFLAVCVYVLSLIITRPLPPAPAQVTDLKAALTAKGFTLAADVTQEDGKIRTPCFSPSGLLCSLHYTPEGQFLDLGVATPEVTEVAISDFVAAINAVAPGWDCRGWVEGVANGEGGAKAVEVRGGYKITVQKAFVLILLVERV